MIRVRVSICPGGDERRERTLAGLLIGNITSLSDISDYHVTHFENAAPHLGVAETDGAFLINNHGRRQSVWHLIAKAAAAAGRRARTAAKQEGENNAR